MAPCKVLISNYYDPKVDNDNNNHSVRSGSSLVVQNMQNIRLPQIQLPKFLDASENWLEFRDTFDSLINQNELINDIRKFHYLRVALEGVAAQIIRSLEFLAVNYRVA